MRSGFVTGDGLPLRWYEWGPIDDGSPIVLLHGVTESASTWLTIAELLSLRRRVIAIDARGHGQSGWSEDEAYAADAHFADLCCALDGLAVRSCTLAGFSMGGAVATMYAAARPERTRALVLIDAYPDPELSAGSQRIARYIAGLSPEQKPGLPARFDPAISRRMREELDGEVARRLDLWPFWECAAVPALIVRGEHSDVLTVEMADCMVRRRRDTRLVTVPGVAHQVPSHRPQELARLLNACG